MAGWARGLRVGPSSALGRQNKMTRAAEQYQYILRDESTHCTPAST
jgi:ribonucleotide reductase beta subunit family protein with ferritin-like domain